MKDKRPVARLRRVLQRRNLTFFHIFRTDVAGGYSSSMLDAIRRAVDTSKALCMQDAQLQPLSYKEVFRLATLGGSEGKQVLLNELNSSLSCELHQPMLCFNAISLNY